MIKKLIAHNNIVNIMWLRRIFSCFSDPDKKSKTPHTHDADTSSYKTKERIPQKMRNNVWVRYNGEQSEGICYSCGIKIHRYNNGWHCSHVKAEAKGGEITLENLRTCCRTCNLSMGNQSMYAYIRDKNMTGPGAKNVAAYMKKHPSQEFNKRTNNWGKT